MKCTSIQPCRSRRIGGKGSVRLPVTRYTVERQPVQTVEREGLLVELPAGIAQKWMPHEAGSAATALALLDRIAEHHAMQGYMSDDLLRWRLDKGDVVGIDVVRPAQGVVMRYRIVTVRV